MKLIHHPDLQQIARIVGLPPLLYACLSNAIVPTDYARGTTIKNAMRQEATPLPLSSVRLTGGPLSTAQKKTAVYLLQLEPDRMLHFYRDRAGLEAKAPPYGGWDGSGRQLTGHIAGHYLSAVSLMWAATGDQRFKGRADYVVDQLEEVQKAHGDGYVGAIMDGRKCFEEVSRGEIRSSGFDLNGLWAPWYTLHKTFAGLRDSYRFAGNDKALQIEIGFAVWAERVLANLSNEQIQQMLNAEFGGMNEVLADLYADSGDERWLRLSHKFEHDAVLNPLKNRQDNLAGKHGNTQIPKLLGSAARYLYVGNPSDGEAAKFFWDRVTAHHSFATGGHGKDEYFGEPDKLSARIHGRTAESCNVYNMLKLTRLLFSLDPKPEYAEFQERALFNHVLGSIDPADASMCYMVPVGQAVTREYSDMFENFTCCVGTGMESHALHGYGIYYESGAKLWVNLYAPSTVNWGRQRAKLDVQTDFPLGDSATVTLTLESPTTFTLGFRRPSWAGERFSVSVNGEAITELPSAGNYVDVERRWQSGDRVELVLPKRLRWEALPDNSRRAAMMWGPLMLVGDLGNTIAETNDSLQQQLPVLVAANQPIEKVVKPVEDRPGVFRTVGAGREREFDLQPFYVLHRHTYVGYFDLLTPTEWEKKAADIKLERERRQRLEKATVAYAQPGEMQPERDFNFTSLNSEPIRVEGRAGRVGSGWFAFDIPVASKSASKLVVTYRSDEWQRRRPSFQVLVDGNVLATEDVLPTDPPTFVDKEYMIPREFTEGKKQVTVRFEAAPRSVAGPVFGVRMTRTNTQE